ncbi:MAG: hypothetical protein JSV86_01055 [Gemmatimonadota bacterium]|nr:MAG: hypothetical protein JSV86_01055 [Gemmatimonadota bacterium]
MKHIVRFSISVLLLGLIPAISGQSARAQGPVVRAVLFFSPTCRHCHKVINEDLPVIFQRFGGNPRVYFDRSLPQGQVAFYDISNGRLEVLLVDASKLAGNTLFRQATERFSIASGGVPRMIVGDSVLVGSRDIPAILPQLVESGLAGDGIEWPDLTGIRQALAAIPGLPLAAAEVESAGEGEGGAEAQPEQAEAAREARPGQTETAAPEQLEGEPPARTAAGTEGEVERQAAGEGAAASPDAGLEETVPEFDAPPESQPADVPAPAEAERSATESDTESRAEPVEAPVAESEGAEVTPGEVDSVPGENADAALPLIPAQRPTMIELYRQDPVGNSVSVVVLIGMLLSLALVGFMSQQPTSEGGLGIAVPVTAAIGIAVAGYLTYIESSGATAVCGPVGDCNTVNQSEYAMLFGVVPVGALGLAGYVAIIAAWLVSWRDSGRPSDWAKLALLAMAMLGTLFSIYLTFLEPFVIGATCAWCLTSAVAITLLMLLSARPGLDAWARIRAG